MKQILLILAIGTYLLAEPSWVNNPNTGQYIGGVGIVKDKTQRKLAKIKARASLLESIKVHLSSKSVLNKSTSGSQYDTSFEQTIFQEAIGYLENNFVKDTYVDEDGYYYIWIVVEK